MKWNWKCGTPVSHSTQRVNQKFQQLRSCPNFKHDWS